MSFNVLYLLAPPTPVTLKYKESKSHGGKMLPDKVTSVKSITGILQKKKPGVLPFI